jgi:hypothetical protein
MIILSPFLNKGLTMEYFIVEGKIPLDRAKFRI